MPGFRNDRATRSDGSRYYGLGFTGSGFTGLGVHGFTGSRVQGSTGLTVHWFTESVGAILEDLGSSLLLLHAFTNIASAISAIP
jgi:hypothetical protein